MANFKFFFCTTCTSDGCLKWAERNTWFRMNIPRLDSNAQAIDLNPFTHLPIRQHATSHLDIDMENVVVNLFQDTFLYQVNQLQTWQWIK